jgi:hypothetical protein
MVVFSLIITFSRRDINFFTASSLIRTESMNNLSVYPLLIKDKVIPLTGGKEETLDLFEFVWNVFWQDFHGEEVGLYVEQVYIKKLAAGS